MDELVPDFHVEQDYQISTSAALPRPNKSPMAEEEIMELLWQNGQVVMQSQRSINKSEQPLTLPDEEPPSGTTAAAAHNLFIQEDEMASWLHYPMEDSSFDRDLYSDLFYPPPSCPQVSAPPPLPPAPRPSGEEPCLRVQQNFAHFSRAKAPREPSAVVSSNVTPVAVEAYGGNIGRGLEQVGTSFAAGGRVERETRMSSPGGSGGSISVGGKRLGFAAVATTEDRKRKAVEADDNDCQSEDLDFESPDAKKQTRGSTSTKRSRAAEVHNLSERRRRDRINEKMRALQELIPRCNKSDKASMLDEAIEYLKSLQMQVQMMSMGCGMVPMMFPGMQQYMPPMGMMGMEMGINRPTMMPFIPMMPGSALPNSGTTSYLGPRIPMPAAYHMQQSVPLPNPTSTQDPMINSKTRNVNQPQMQFFSDPYQQYIGLQQVPLPQNQVMTQPSTSRPTADQVAVEKLGITKIQNLADRREMKQEKDLSSQYRTENDKNHFPANVGWLIQL